MARLPEAKEGLHDRRERAERKAHGAQRPRHNNELGEGASTAQRSDPFAQQVVQTFPNEQNLRAHAPLIHGVVQDCLNPAPHEQLASMLEAAKAQGLGRLVGAIRAILAGRRDRFVLLGLDDEDRVITEAILAGIANPASLPPLQAQGGPHDGGTRACGDDLGCGTRRRAGLERIGQHGRTDGACRRRHGTAGRDLRRLIDGECNADLLSRGMGSLWRSLISTS